MTVSRVLVGLASTAFFLSASWPTAALAQNGTELAPDDRQLQVDRTPVYRIGGIDAPTWATFGNSLVLDFDDQGVLYILDVSNNRVVVVGPDGRHVRDLGREGGGPGEFQRPGTLTVRGDGSVVVVDRVRRRLIHYGSGGALIGDYPAVIGSGFPTSLFHHPRGVVGPVFVYLLNGETQVRTPEGFQPVEGQPIQVYSLERDPVGDVIHMADLPPRPASGPDGRRPLSAFFPDLHMAGLSGGVVAVVDDGAYRLTLIGTGGEPVGELRRRIPRPPVTEGVRQAERERLLRALAEGRPPENTFSFGGNRMSEEEQNRRFRDRIANMVFPDSLPAIHGLRADPAGRLWVQRTNERGGPGIIDLIEDRRYVGSLPGELALPAALGPDGLAAFVTYDELDVPTIRVERLTVR